MPSSSYKASILSKIAIASAHAGLSAPLVLLVIVIGRLAVSRLRKQATRVNRSINIERDRWQRKITLSELISGPPPRSD
jgi:hypothetical protein